MIMQLSKTNLSIQLRMPCGENLFFKDIIVCHLKRDIYVVEIFVFEYVNIILAYLSTYYGIRH